MSRDVEKRAIEMYSYHGELGLERKDLQFCSVVQDNDFPDVWSSNKAYSNTARSTEEIQQLIHEVDDFFGQLPYRHFVVDPLTPEPFQAYLALNEYSEYSTVIQMILQGMVTPTPYPPEAHMRPVISENDWLALRNLVLVDHAEGERTNGSLTQAVTDGIVAGYRGKAGRCQFFLAELNGKPCAYGSGTNCTNGMGMVEDLFTLPDFRGRGLASKMISHCVDFCRARGADQILIGSHANEPPKHLYNKLGFKPAFLTRGLIKQL